MVYFFMFFRYLTIGHHLISQLCTSQKYKVHIQRVHVMQDFDTFHFLRCWKIYILNHWTIFFELQCGIPLVPCSSHDLQDSNNRGMGEEGATLYDGALTGNSIVLHSGRGAVRQRSYIVAFLSAGLQHLICHDLPTRLHKPEYRNVRDWLFIARSHTSTTQKCVAAQRFSDHFVT